MATVYWSGNQKATPRKYTFSVTAVAAAGTLTATINSKVETYTVTAADAAAGVSTVAANFVTALSSSLILELANFTFAVSTAEITATGPADGMPLAITFAASGGSTTIGSIVTVSPTSPNAIDDAANWTGGVPTNGDTAVFENTSISALYNLSALTAVTFLLVKRASYGGQIGLPDTNALGYPEYLATHLFTAGLTHVIEDNGVMCRVKTTSASAVTVTITGGGGGAVNAESVEVWGSSHASSVLNIAGGTCACAPLTSQTAVFGTVRVLNGVLRAGQGATFTAVTVSTGKAQLAGAYTTLAIDRGSAVSAERAAAAATSTSVQGGTLSWNSTGGWGALTVGSDGVVDVSGAPTAITSGAITLEEGYTFNNPYDRVTRPYTISWRGELSKGTIDIGTAQSATVN